MSSTDRVVTSDEEEGEEEDEDDDEEQGFDMSSFLFGNVDKHGELEADFFDEVWLDIAHLLVINRPTMIGS